MTPTAAPLQSERRHGATKNKSPAFSQKRGFGVAMQPLPAEGLLHHELLGFGSSASGSGSSGVSSSLGSVSSRSGGVVSSRGCSCVGSSRSSFGSSWSCRSGFSSRSWSSCGSWCWSGFFFFTASGQSSSSDQSGQNDGVLHFKFPSWTNKNLEKPRRPAR